MKSISILKNRRSILDVLQFESESAKRILSKSDFEKLDEYSNGIRDVEKAIIREELWVNVPYPKTIKLLKMDLSVKLR